MIELRNVERKFGKGRRAIWRSASEVTVFRDVNASIDPCARTVILGKPHSGKTTLLRLLSGSMPPSRGRIVRNCSVSFIVGKLGRVGTQTVRQVIHFVADIYNVNRRALERDVIAFAELAEFADVEVTSLDALTRGRFAYTLSYMLPFDCYLCDEVVVYGDALFRKKCLTLFEARCDSAGAVIATSNVSLARQFGTQGGVIWDGKLKMFDEVNKAIEYFLLRSEERPFPLERAKGGTGLATAAHPPAKLRDVYRRLLSRQSADPE